MTTYSSLIVSILLSARSQKITEQSYVLKEKRKVETYYSVIHQIIQIHGEQRLGFVQE